MPTRTAASGAPEKSRAPRRGAGRSSARCTRQRVANRPSECCCSRRACTCARRAWACRSGACSAAKTQPSNSACRAPHRRSEDASSGWVVRSGGAPTTRCWFHTLRAQTQPARTRRQHASWLPCRSRHFCVHLRKTSHSLPRAGSEQAPGAQLAQAAQHAVGRVCHGGASVRSAARHRRGTRRGEECNSKRAAASVVRQSARAAREQAGAAAARAWCTTLSACTGVARRANVR